MNQSELAFFVLRRCLPSQEAYDVCCAYTFGAQSRFNQGRSAHSMLTPNLPVKVLEKVLCTRGYSHKILRCLKLWEKLASRHKRVFVHYLRKT